MASLAIRNAEVGGCVVDVVAAGERVIAVGPGRAEPADVEIDATGGAVLPGLHDHHVHLLAWAAAAGSVGCGPPDVTTPEQLAAVLRAAAATPGGGWIRGVGYHESVAGDLDRHRLDSWVPDRPVRVQHRSGALWMLNSPAVDRLGLVDEVAEGVERDPAGRPTGRLWRLDGWLAARLAAGGEQARPDLGAVAARLASYGVTGVTDATADLTREATALLLDASRRRLVPQHLHLLGVPLERRIDAGRVSTGPYKIVVADSAPLDLADLTARIGAAHEAGRPVAVHTVTRASLLVVLAAFAGAGVRPGDRLEHAAVVPADVLPDLAGSGLVVVTQPGFVAARGDDYLDEVDSADLECLYRYRSLLAAGVPVALSSDAPFGPADPWQVLAAAAERRAGSGRVVGAAERVDVARALPALLTPLGAPGAAPRRVEPGAIADLVVLDGPLTDVVADPHAGRVRATVIAGEVVHSVF